MNTKSIFLLCMWLCVACFVQAQVPQLISYQAVARDLTGKVLFEKAISVQVEILQGSNSGPVAYSESHALTTTKTGTINLLIGGGDVINGVFASIDWGNGPYFMKLSMKQDKEVEYKEVSNTQMLSVPYALYAEKAGEVVTGGSGGNASESVNFVLIKDDEHDDDNWLYNILLGNEIEGYSGDTFPFELRFCIVYLNGINQELSASIEGFSDTEIIFEMSSSSPMGRYCSFTSNYQDIPTGQYNLKLLIKNKNGVVLNEYPFVFNLK
ncbi:hypothetical protein [uncultured Parabacteroides sp.]|nr:hypothetical protein [uncultured Parabacteroides sp.]